MSVITLQFSLQDDLGADLIAWFGHGAAFSHVDTVLPDGSLLGARSDVCAGVPAGVQIRPPNYARFKSVLRVDLPATPLMASRYYAFVRAQLGKPYDMEAIIAFVVGRNWRNPNAWICSELCGRGLEVSEFFPYLLATPASKLTPPDLVLLASTRALVHLPPAMLPHG